MLQIVVNYNCLSTKSKGRVKITVKDWENKCLADLKLLVEEKLHAPVCDQILSYRGQNLRNDSRSLKDLYLRTKDEFEVKFPSEAETQQIRENVDDLKRFAEKMCSEKDRILNLSSHPDPFEIDMLQSQYLEVMNALDSLSVNFLSPWRRPKTVANRHFFVQINGFSSLMKILRFSLKKYEVEDEDLQESNNNVYIMEYLNILQYKVLVWCLYFLWNFCETANELKLMTNFGVLQLATSAFLLDPNIQSLCSTLNDELRNILIEINFHSLGCVTGCTEVDPAARLTLVSNTEAISKMVVMMDRYLPQTKEMYTLFCSECAVHGIFYCTWSSETHSLFLQNGLLVRIIEIISKSIGDSAGDIVIRYFGCLVLAVLSSSCSVELDSTTVNTINHLIDDFLQCHKPDEMLDWEEEHGYVWVTLVPLIHLAFAGGPPVKKPHFWEKTKRDSTGIGCENIETGAYMIDVVEKLNLCHIGSVIEQKANVVVRTEKQSFKDEVKNKTKQIPRPLSDHQHLTFGTNGKATCSKDIPAEARFPGSTSTQKLGLFALRYVLCVEENRSLAESEKLLEYLTCLCWTLQLEERSVLIEQLKKFNIIRVPSLKTVCKSLIAKIYGFQAVL